MSYCKVDNNQIFHASFSTLHFLDTFFQSYCLKIEMKLYILCLTMVRTNRASRNSSVLDIIKEKGDDERPIAPTSFNAIVWNINLFLLIESKQTKQT